MSRALIVTFTSILLSAIVAEFNHVLAEAHVYLFVGGLFVSVPALILPLRSGIAASFLIGLTLDSMTPVPFGTHAILFGIAHTVIFNVRDRLPRTETAGRVAIALIANLGIFLLFSFINISRSPTSAAAVWPRLIADLVCSQIFVTLVTPWFFSLQVRALSAVRAEPARLD